MGHGDTYILMLAAVGNNLYATVLCAGSTVRTCVRGSHADVDRGHLHL